MNKWDYAVEMHEIQGVFGRFSPKQVRTALAQLEQDLEARPNPEQTGIKVGDQFTEDAAGIRHARYVLRPRLLDVLGRMSTITSDGVDVGLVLLRWATVEDLPSNKVWAGWMPVADPTNLTDQEWERVRDYSVFDSIAPIA